RRIAAYRSGHWSALHWSDLGVISWNGDLWRGHCGRKRATAEFTEAGFPDPYHRPDRCLYRYDCDGGGPGLGVRGAVRPSCRLELAARARERYDLSFGWAYRMVSTTQAALAIGARRGGATSRRKSLALASRLARDGFSRPHLADFLRFGGLASCHSPGQRLPR